VTRQSKGEKQTKKKEQKLKKQRTRRATMPAILRRDPLLAESLRYHLPLHSCLINKNWQSMKMVAIFVVREAQAGLVMVTFFIDLTGFGLKEVWGDYGLTPSDIDTIKSKSVEDDLPLESCDLPFASSIIYGGVEWAKKWGVKLPKDYKVWMRILEPLDADSIDLDLFGVDGKPLFLVDDEEDLLFGEFEIDLNLLKDPIKIGENGPSKKQLERIGDIKGALIRFSTNPEFNEEFNDAKSEYSGEAKHLKDMKAADNITFLDWYALEWESEWGDTFPDRFVASHGDLMSRDVREMILGWRDVIDGIFEIKGKRPDGYYMKNLVNEREYTVYSTASMEDAPSFEIGDFMGARIVPVQDFHTFSGIVAKMPCDGSDKARGDIYRIVIETQTLYPRKAFKDNEEKLKKSIELVRRDYDEFVGYFGSDELIGSGREMAQRHQDFLRYTVFDKKDPQTGLSSAEKYEREQGKAYQLPRINYPGTLLKQSDVGMLFDPLEGVTFLEEWSLFVDIFRNPDVHISSWIKNRKVKDVIEGYLESDSISDIPFRKMAKRFPDNFARVIRYVLNWEEFSVDMIDDLMRYYKPETFDKLPAHVAVLDSEIMKFAYSKGDE